MNSQGQFDCKYLQHKPEEIMGICIKSNCYPQFYCCKCISTLHIEHQDCLIQLRKFHEILQHNVQVLQDLLKANSELVRIERILIQSHIQKLELIMNYEKNIDPGIFIKKVNQLKKEYHFYEKVQQVVNNENKQQELLILIKDHLWAFKYLQKQSKNSDQDRSPSNQEFNQEAEDLMNQGIELVQLKKNEEAYFFFEKVLTIIPYHYQALVEIAKIFQLSGCGDFSLHYLYLAIHENPYCCDAYILAMNILKFSIKYEEFIKIYHKAQHMVKDKTKIQLEQIPNPENRQDFKYQFADNSDYHDTLLGRIQITKPDDKYILNYLVHQNDPLLLFHFDQLEKMFLWEQSKYCDNQLQKGPNIVILLLKSSALYNYKELDQALIIINQVLDIEPNIGFAHNVKGLIMFALTKYDEAVLCYDKALSINPNDDLAYFNKGRALHKMKSYEEALQFYDQAIVLRPKQTLVHCNKGSALHKLKRYNEAINSFNEAIQIDQKNLLAHYNQGLSLYEIQSYQQALDCFNEVGKVFYNVAQVKYHIGRIYYHLLKFEESIKQFNLGLYINPENARIYKCKADVELAQGKNQEAVENLQLAIEKGWDSECKD